MTLCRERETERETLGSGKLHHVSDGQGKHAATLSKIFLNSARILMPSGRAVSGPDRGGCQQASVAQYGPLFNELLTVLSLNRSDILPFIAGISEGLRTILSFAFLYLVGMYISQVLAVVCLLL